MSREQRSYQQLHQISSATLLEESSHLRIVMQGIIVVAVVIIALIIWAAFSKIQETAVTFGEVIPEGQIQLIQHLEGGIVSKVLVNDGDTVKKGQLLIEMKSGPTVAELEQLRAREIALILDKVRLTTFLEKTSGDSVDWSQAVVKSKYNSVKNASEIKQLIEAEKAHLASQYKSYQDQTEILKSELDKKHEQVKEIQTQEAVMDRHIKLLTEEFDMYAKLKEKHYISHRDYLIVVRDLNRAKGERVRQESQMEQVKKEIEETQYKLKEHESTTREEMRKELGLTTDNLIEIHHKIEKLEERLERLNVTSPVAGIVKGVTVFAGNVIQPGGQLLEVVPLGKINLIESRVSPRDIGFVKAGDKVKVKILAYDFARYGAISGKLVKISAATFQDKDGNPYYKATISLEKQYIGNDANKKYLKPGMTVQADVLTGEKTILQYLLKPIHRARDAAFSER